MNRRRILGLIGTGAIGLSGCAESLESRADATPSPGRETSETTATSPTPGETTSTPTNGTPAHDGETETADTASLPVTCPPTEVRESSDEPDQGWPRVSVDSDPDPYDDVAMDATVLAQFTDACPAAVRVSLTNTSESVIEANFGWSYPFSVYENSDEDGPGLNLIPVYRGGAVETAWRVDGNETNVPTAKRDGCWSVEYQGFFTIGKPLRLQPDETVSNVYKVFNDIRNEECLPPGEYRFVQERYMSRDGTWGLTLSIGSSSRR